MDVFTQSIHVEAGQPLGGYAVERLSRSASDELELNGLCFDDPATGLRIELCTLDALYAGDLFDTEIDSISRRIFAASHTHFAPMLDSGKPQLGAVSAQALNAWRSALREAQRCKVSPSQCTIWRAEVTLPIYRRFDVPDSLVNRWLTRRAGMFPNSLQSLDRNVYFFELGDTGRTDAVIVLHACHPVSRADRNHTSSDYVGALRNAVRARFGNVPCLFLLGCSGDVRPNFARKRISLLPRGRLNLRFEWPTQSESELLADMAYAEAVAEARLWRTIGLPAGSLRFESMLLSLKHQPAQSIPCLCFSDQLRFEFVPFEVSHLFHLEAQKKDSMRFIVSCADRTLGYLPHPSQLAAGGYEVDGSRHCMGLKERALLSSGSLW